MLLNFVESCLIFRQDEATFYFMLLKLHTVSNQHQSGLQCSFAIFYLKKRKKKDVPYKRNGNGNVLLLVSGTGTSLRVAVQSLKLEKIV